MVKCGCGSTCNCSVETADTETVALSVTGNGAEGSPFHLEADLLRVPEVIVVCVSDETTDLTVGTAKVTFRMPYPMDLTAVRASLTAASSSGNPTFDVNEEGSSIFGANKLSVDSGEETSVTATTPVSLSDVVLADNAEITIDIDTAGTGAKGAKIYFIGTRAL